MPILSGSDEEMRKSGWVKEITWRDIGLPDANGICIVTDYDFFAKDIACENCNSGDFCWVTAQRTGIFWACSLCKRVNGPLAVSFGRPVRTTRITAQQAVKIFRDRGVKRIPQDFMPKKGRRMPRPPRRRPKKVA